MKRKNLFLGLILFLAFFLRFYQLGQVPCSPDWDEAALGYNAYSLLKTGRDEYGQRLPLILRSFDDYKPAIYAYLIIPFLKIFGLNIFSVRLPAAFLGTLAVFLTYFLVKELFNKKNNLNILISQSRQTRSQYPNILPEVAALLLALSPWHLQFSRIAFESNIGVFFNILMALLFLKGLKKPSLLVFAALVAGLNIYVYQAEKIFTPLLVLAMIIIWRQELGKIPKKYLLASLGIGLILLLPFIQMVLATPEIFLRARGTSVAADQTPFLARSVEKLQRDQENQNYLGLILDNRRIVYLLAFINGYLSHFDLNWLFITGDEARHHAPGVGLLYLWELPFLFLGIYSLIFKKISSKAKTLIFAWFFLAPIPASFTSGVPHAVRTLRFLPMIQIFVAVGLLTSWLWLKKQKKKNSLYSLIPIAYCLFFIFNFLYYFNQYFIQQNYFNSQSWQYGYQEAIEVIQGIEQNYQKIVVSNEPHLDQSYIFFLFYLQYDPKTYQASGGTVSGGFAEKHTNFSKYTFRPIKWEEEEKTPEILYVGRPDDFPEGAKMVKLINFLDGQPAIKLVQGR